MMTSAQMVALIRAKKKKMEDEHSGAVKLSGIPEDAADMLVLKNKEEGERLSENHPKDHDEEPSLDSGIQDDEHDMAHEMSAPDPHEVDEDKTHEERMKKMRMYLMGMK